MAVLASEQAAMTKAACVGMDSIPTEFCKSVWSPAALPEDAQLLILLRCRPSCGILAMFPLAVFYIWRGSHEACRESARDW
jgi:hypothetical protein